MAWKQMCQLFEASITYTKTHRLIHFKTCGKYSSCAFLLFAPSEIANESRVLGIFYMYI